MNERIFRIATFLLPLTLIACLGSTGDGSDGSSDAASSASSSSAQSVKSVSSMTETRNVTYQGVVEEAGISVYMEGSHRLALEDGRFLLLESDAVELSTYENRNVEVTGSLRPTVEAGGIIMRVDRVVLLESSSAASEEIASSAAMESDVPTSSLAMQEETPVSSTAQIVSSAPATQEPDSSSTASAATSSAAASPAISSSASASAELESRIVAMASHDTASTNWTQEYCTEHIGFCFPIHRNWWFHSFGVTTSMLWHVEIGPEEITNLGDGPIHVNFISGTVASKKAADGQVRVQGNTVIGFREWTDNRHFEIVADARLEDAVSYITANLFAMPEAE